MVIKKWNYDVDGVYSTNLGDHSKTHQHSMNQTTEIYNGKHICLYGEDSLGKKYTKLSAYTINIDATPPSIGQAILSGFTFINPTLKE